jgi:Domain of Unknown Function with PDB structure (DUF3857)/Protein of unknown function (DUF2569)
MRIALSIILSLLLTPQLQALPLVKTSPLPGWLYPIHPDLQKKPARDDISNGYYYTLYDLQSNLNCNTEYTHYIRDIANGSGVQNGSEVSVTFAPEFQQVVFHRINILRDGATIDRLQLSNIKVVQEETDADEFQYNGLKRAFLTIKDIRKGDRIEVAFSIIGFNPVFGNHYSDDFSFSTSTAVCNYYKTIITNRPLYIQTINNAPAPLQQRQGNTLIYTWVNPSLNTDEPGSDVPSWYNNNPTVYVTEFQNWEAVVHWGLSTFNNYHYPIPASLQKKIAEWQTSAKGDKSAFTTLALRFVQDEVRYLGLELGVNTHQPHPPAETFTQRFGDCKDKALLLTTILQQQGIPAYAALLNTDTRSELTHVAPSAGAFDHAIVAIAQPSGSYAFIDPTRSYQRGNLNDLYIPAYGYALVLREGETGLRTITPGRINDYTITESLDAAYYDTSHFSITSIYSGGAADELRQLFAETSRKDLEENYRKYYQSLFNDIHQEGKITYSEDSDKNIVTVTKHYAVPQLWNTEKSGKRYFSYKVNILEQNIPDPSKAVDNTPLALTYPFNVHYTLDLALPDDWEFGDGELHIHNEAFQFDFTPEVHGSNMTLHYNFRTLQDHIPASALRQYKKDYDNMLDRISFELYKDITPENAAPEHTSPRPATGPSTVDPKDWQACWPAIWLTFFFSLLFSRLFRYLNVRGEETQYAPGSGYPLGGWIMLLGISLAIILLRELGSVFLQGFYSNIRWTYCASTGGNALQYLFLSDLAIHLTFIAGSISLLFWFFTKRDIFPRMFCWFAAVLITGRILLLGLSWLSPASGTLDGMRSGMIYELIFTTMYSAIWIAFILRSGQVRSTFLEPFRERIH